jgi:hypothetical protein
MEALLEFLRMEAKVYDNAEAAAILRDWERSKVMPDTAIYTVGRMRKARAAIVAVSKAKARARRDDKAARDAAEATRAAGEGKVSAARAARDRLKAKLHRPH